MGPPDLVLATRGARLSADEANQLEERLRVNPNDLPTRVELIGYYARRTHADSRANKHRHILWLIVNHPGSRVAGSPFSALLPSRDFPAYLKASALWLSHIEERGNEIAILGNAARFFEYAGEFLLPEMLLRRCLESEPSNHKWATRLAELYSRWATRMGQGPEAADLLRRAHAVFERSDPPTENALAQSIFLVAASRAALDAGDLEAAHERATKALDSAELIRKTFEYGNVIHFGHILLGRIALRRNDVETAKAHLLQAGRTPGSPQLKSFGPNMSLARELLEGGERRTVLAFMDLLSFWTLGASKIARWRTTIDRGEIPDFGANLHYY